MWVLPDAVSVEDTVSVVGMQALTTMQAMNKPVIVCRWDVVPRECMSSFTGCSVSKAALLILLKSLAGEGFILSLFAL